MSDDLLALWFTPQAIRDHFDGHGGDIEAAVAFATDEQLRDVAEWCLNADALYREFDRFLVAAIEARLAMPRAAAERGGGGARTAA